MNLKLSIGHSQKMSVIIQVLKFGVIVFLTFTNKKMTFDWGLDTRGGWGVI